MRRLGWWIEVTTLLIPGSTTLRNPCDSWLISWSGSWGRKPRGIFRAFIRNLPFATGRSRPLRSWSGPMPSAGRPGWPSCMWATCRGIPTMPRRARVAGNCLSIGEGSWSWRYARWAGDVPIAARPCRAWGCRRRAARKARLAPVWAVDRHSWVVVAGSRGTGRRSCHGRLVAVIKAALRIGAWRRLVARLLWEQDAGCSNHLAPTRDFKGIGRVRPIPFIFWITGLENISANHTE